MKPHLGSPFKDKGVWAGFKPVCGATFSKRSDYRMSNNVASLPSRAECPDCLAAVQSPSFKLPSKDPPPGWDEIA